MLSRIRFSVARRFSSAAAAAVKPNVQQHFLGVVSKAQQQSRGKEDNETQVTNLLKQRNQQRDQKQQKPPTARPALELQKKLAKKPEFHRLTAFFKPKDATPEELRSKGFIPGRIVSSPGLPFRTLPVYFKASEIRNQVQQNQLLCRVFEVDVSNVPGSKESMKYFATVYRAMSLPTSGETPLSVEMMLWHPNAPARVTIPIQFEGLDECAGKKLGGMVYFASDRVQCVWVGDHNIPSKFVLDMKSAELGSTFHVSDLKFPAGLAPLSSSNFPVCSVRGGRVKDMEESKEGDAAAAVASVAGTPAPTAGKDDKAADKAGGDKKADGSGDKKDAAPKKK